MCNKSLKSSPQAPAISHDAEGIVPCATIPLSSSKCQDSWQNIDLHNLTQINDIILKIILYGKIKICMYRVLVKWVVKPGPGREF